MLVQLFLETVRLGLNNLRLQLLRSILTAMGIIFGVAAVIIMVAIGEGATRDALAQIERLGARNIIVRSQKPPENQGQGPAQRQSFVSRFGLTRTDLAVIRENFPDAEAIVPLREVGGQVLRNEFRKTSQAFGTTPEFIDVANLKVARGRYLNQADLDDQALVGVIGHELARQFFPFDDPLGNTLRIDSRPITIVGVLAPVGLSGGAGAALIGRDLNLDMHIPFTAAESAFGEVVFRSQSGAFQASAVQISEIYIQAPSRERVELDAQRIRRIVENRHPDNDWSMVVPYELLAEARRTRMTANAILIAIASISLLVGGIGIMNIMLASVTERTREIGIRRAVGATRKHILWQFLVETSVLSSIGGLIGVILGVSFGVGLERVVPQLENLPLLSEFVPAGTRLPTSITTWSILVSFIVATLTGLIFGIYPARRASRQDPIVALRHD
ncbi:MAG: ABC transporter permease [Planctomycetota bacterium]|nr:ABC transporter permease [Planctomycetota bacterium]